MKNFQFAFDARDEDGETFYLGGRSGFYSMRLNIAGVRP
jgi:hypothetical protein